MTTPALGIYALVSAISDDVKSRLLAAGYPALVDGKILIGRQHVFEASSAPRIVFVPMGIEHAPKDVAAPDHTGADYSLEKQWRSIGTDMLVFEVHAWGQDPLGRADQDWDAAQALEWTLHQTLHAMASGCFQFLPGKWTSGMPQNTQLIKAGQELVFGLKIATPVLAELLQYAPADVEGTAGVNVKDRAGHTIDHEDVR